MGILGLLQYVREHRTSTRAELSCYGRKEYNMHSYKWNSLYLFFILGIMF